MLLARKPLIAAHLRPTRISYDFRGIRLVNDSEYIARYCQHSCMKWKISPMACWCDPLPFNFLFRCPDLEFIGKARVPTKRRVLWVFCFYRGERECVGETYVGQRSRPLPSVKCRVQQLEDDPMDVADVRLPWRVRCFSVSYPNKINKSMSMEKDDRRW